MVDIYESQDNIPATITPEPYIWGRTPVAVTTNWASSANVWADIKAALGIDDSTVFGDGSIVYVYVQMWQSPNNYGSIYFYSGSTSWGVPIASGTADGTFRIVPAIGSVVYILGIMYQGVY
jgi:hypothetical protein